MRPFPCRGGVRRPHQRLPWEGGVTLAFLDCCEEFMSCPAGGWTWAEHHQHHVLGNLCPPMPEHSEVQSSSEPFGHVKWWP